MTRVAVMQPYFLPYAGYFRLFTDTDVFVALDNVQYVRRGWIHRNKLIAPDGRADWLTVPFRKGDYEMLISDLEFGDGASADMEQRMAKFPARGEPNAATAGILDRARDASGSGRDYLVALLAAANAALGIATPIVCASTLATDPSSRGADRLIDICQAVGATRYVNASGGVGLYEPEQFAHRGIELIFHRPYEGDLGSILQRLHDSPAAEVRAEIERNV